MKKLFLSTLLFVFTISIDVSATTTGIDTDIDRDRDICAPSLSLYGYQLVPYIYRVLNSSDFNEDSRLDELQKFIGYRVKGWHRSYPEGRTHKEYKRIIGTIQDIRLVKPGDTGKEIYEMVISSEKEGLQKFTFSGSYSPAFSSLEASLEILNLKDLKPSHPLYPLVNAIKEAERNTKLPFDLLSVHLDTPPEVADYKNRLRDEKAVVFYNERYPFYELSNSYEDAPIVIDGEIWPSVVHYVEAQKVLDPRDTPGEYVNENVMNVRMARSPAEAIRMVRYRMSIRSDWEEVKNGVMFKALVAKFTQHTHLYDLLMSTGNARIVQHTKDRYWGDGEDGRGESKLGELLMELRDHHFQLGIIPGNTITTPKAGIMNEVLKQQLDHIKHRSEHFNVTNIYTLARQITFLGISDREKVEKLQMLIDSAHFLRGSNRYPNHTSPDEWIALVNKKYPDDVSFRYQVIKAGISLAGPFALIIDLRPLNLPDGHEIDIYKVMAQNSPEFFVDALPDRFGLDHSKIRELYLYALQFESLVVRYIKKLPREVVNHEFIQAVVNSLHKNSFPTQYYLSTERGYGWRGKVIEDLIKAISSHGLNYRAVYAVDNKPVNESNEAERRRQANRSIERDNILLAPASLVE